MLYSIKKRNMDNLDEISNSIEYVTGSVLKFLNIVLYLDFI